MTRANPHSTARADGSCDDCGSFHGNATPMTLMDRVKRLFSPRPRRVTLSEQIDRCKAAMLKRQARMDELWSSVDYPGQDEHGAALGGVHGEYRALSEKQDRARAWLRVLLAKRGLPEDLRLAEAIRVTAWP